MTYKYMRNQDFIKNTSDTISCKNQDVKRKSRKFKKIEKFRYTDEHPFSKMEP